MSATFAILGATGNVGGEVLTYLLQHTKHKINVLVRSEPKLQKQLSELQLPFESRITVYQGAITDAFTLESCINGMNAVFLCVAPTSNNPKFRTAQTQAESVIAALRSIRANDSAARLPKLVMISSCETEERFNENMPRLIRNLIFEANRNMYLDLIEAEKYIRQQEDWVNATFVKPGGLSHDISRGHEINESQQQTFLSFVDLAAAMVEIAEEDGGRWDGKSVSVTSPRGKQEYLGLYLCCY